MLREDERRTVEALNRVLRENERRTVGGSESRVERERTASGWGVEAAWGFRVRPSQQLVSILRRRTPVLLDAFQRVPCRRLEGVLSERLLIGVIRSAG